MSLLTLYFLSLIFVSLWKWDRGVLVVVSFLASWFRGEREAEALSDRFIAWSLITQVIGILIVVVVDYYYYLTFRACLVRPLVSAGSYCTLCEPVPTARDCH